MKALVVSHKFHPGHISHLMANYKLLDDVCVEVSFLWNGRFNMYVSDEMDVNISARGDLLSLKKDDLFIVWFPSLGALLDMVFLRLIQKGRIVYIFHEPFDSVREYLQSGFSVGKTARIVMASFVSFLLVKCSHKVILPSCKAYETFESRYRFKGGFTKLPLMFDDESKEILEIQDRSYISYIGTIAEDHAFEDFVKFTVHCLELNLFPNFTFLIATRSTLDFDTNDLLSPFKADKRLLIVSGKPITNQAINDYFSKSVVVWNAYRRSMQSGVLPKAYMFGTPVLVRELNTSEYFVDGNTGVEISKNCSSKDISSAINKIVENYSHYSKCCKEKFITCFYYKSQSEEYLSFIMNGQ